MKSQKINIADRDKFAAAFGLVSDVLMYYPKGVQFPIFLNQEMVFASLSPSTDGYIVSVPTKLGAKVFTSSNTLDYFSVVVDKAKEMAENSVITVEEKTPNLIPATI